MPRKPRPHLGERFASHDALAERLAVNVLHEEASAEIIFCAQHVQHARRRHAIRVRGANKFGFERDWD